MLPCMVNANLPWLLMETITVPFSSVLVDRYIIAFSFTLGNAVKRNQKETVRDLEVPMGGNVTACLPLNCKA